MCKLSCSPAYEDYAHRGSGLLQFLYGVAEFTYELIIRGKGMFFKA